MSIDHVHLETPHQQLFPSFSLLAFLGTTKLRGSTELDVSFSRRAVSHFFTFTPRFGIIAMPLAAVVDRNSLMEKQKGCSSTHCLK